MAFRVSGVPVPVATVRRYEEFWKERRPGASPETRVREIIEDWLIPQAAMYAKYYDRVPGLVERARKARARLDAGEPWSTVASEEGDDPNRRSNTGAQGTFTKRVIQGVQPLPPELHQLAFSLPVEGVSEPTMTDLGVQIIRVDKEARGIQGEPQRDVSRILFAFGDDNYLAALHSFRMGMSAEDATAAQAAVAAFKEYAKRVRERSKVEIVDPAFQDLVYPYRLRPDSGG